MALLISHRFSTVRMADRIVVLENGRIAEQGSHQQLMALGGRYDRNVRATGIELPMIISQSPPLDLGNARAASATRPIAVAPVNGWRHRSPQRSRTASRGRQRKRGLARRILAQAPRPPRQVAALAAR